MAFNRHTSYRRLICLLLSIWTFLPLAGAATARAVNDSPAESPESILYSTHWSVSAWRERVTGVACWLVGPAGEVRVEISTDAGRNTGMVDITGMLQQTGRGWTCITTDSGEGTFNRWGAAWSRLGKREVDFIRLLEKCVRNRGHLVELDFKGLAKIIDRQTNTRATPRWLPVDQEDDSGVRVLRLAVGETGAIADDAATGRRSFRTRLVGRGRGLGDTLEIVTIRMNNAVPGAGEASSMEISSSRRIGKLIVAETGERRIKYPYPEVFVPLWTLSELLEF